MTAVRMLKKESPRLRGQPGAARFALFDSARG